LPQNKGVQQIADKSALADPGVMCRTKQKLGGVRMKGKLLFVISGALNILWGIAHLFPTSSIVRGFGSISVDNRRIILMEWINEGLTLIFIGLLVITVTYIDSTDVKAKKGVYVLSAIMLVSMAVLSVFTGFRIDFIPFRLCPFIFTLSAILLLVGASKKQSPI
jgi:hypothetical protein